MKATITWLGGPGEPDSNEWNGVTFQVRQPVEIEDAYMLKKAAGNPFYEVTDGEPSADPKPTAADRMAKVRAARKPKVQDPDKVDT